MRDIDHYRSMLRIDKHALDDALERQSTILEEIGHQAALAEARAAVAKEDLEREEAREFRAVKSEDPKATVDTIKAAIAVSRACMAARAGALAAKAQADEWQALSKAWYARGFDLKALAELYAADYFSLTQVSATRSMPDGELRRAVRRRVREG